MRSDIIDREVNRAIDYLKKQGIHVKRQHRSEGDGFRGYLSCTVWHEDAPENFHQAVITIYGPDDGFDLSLSTPMKMEATVAAVKSHPEADWSNVNQRQRNGLTAANLANRK